MDRMVASDEVEKCRATLAFIDDAISQPNTTSFELSEDGLHGLHLALAQTRDRLKVIAAHVRSLEAR